MIAPSSLFSRRALALGGLSLSAAAVLGPRWAQAEARADEPANKLLVCVFLRGAADGLSLVVPHDDEDYYRARPSIAIARPGRPGGAIDLDGRFGLHPRLRPLEEAFRAKQLALIHAVGSPHPTRSHFEAQDHIEIGRVDRAVSETGFLGNYLSASSTPEGTWIRSVAFSPRPPLALRGYPDAVAVPSLKRFRLASERSLRPLLTSGFERLYAAGNDPSARAGERALALSARMRKLLKGEYEPQFGANYGREGQPFADVARLYKAGIGLETAWIDVGGWDTHKRQGNAEEGELNGPVAGLGKALAAFRTDLGPRFEHVAVLVMTEFGRTVRENGTGGTDHGHGSAMLLLGGGVRGGRVYGDFPSLARESLHEGRDLPVTTDYRDILAEVLERHLAFADAAPIFPGYELAKARRLGLFS